VAQSYASPAARNSSLILWHLSQYLQSAPAHEPVARCVRVCVCVRVYAELMDQRSNLIKARDAALGTRKVRRFSSDTMKYLFSIMQMYYVIIIL
jgi:hypothetical protein